jgi:predicted site-specific integrase-resolvase
MFLQRKYHVSRYWIWHRKGFEKMMKEVMDEKAEQIVCTHKDRLDLSW